MTQSTDPHDNNTLEAVLAFMDDTTFIDTSKDYIQSTIDLKSEFYTLHAFELKLFVIFI